MNFDSIKAISVAIDVGRDSTKVACSYVLNGKLFCKKIARTEQDGPFLAWGYYDDSNEQWSFAEDVYSSVEKNFMTVVRIKALLSLLSLLPDKDVQEKNFNFYNNEYLFPKFYFPEIQKNEKDFSLLVEKQMAFKSKYTPKQVCEQYIQALFDEYIVPGVKNIAGVDDNTKITYVSVYPANSSAEYKDELVRMIKKASGSNNVISISSTKAVGLYAYNVGAIKDGDQALVVNLGDRETSVAKIDVCGFGKGLSITADGADAHNKPTDVISGEKVTETLHNLVEYKLSQREILGCFAGVDVVNERGTYFQQFLMLNNIKNAKICFSLEDTFFRNTFSKGVPVATERDVVVNVNVTRDEFCEGIYVEEENKKVCKVLGIYSKENDSIGNKLVEYIIEELDRPESQQVKKVIMVGGPSETYNLKEYVHVKLDDYYKKKGRKVNVVILEDAEFNDNENEVYASAVGAAIQGTSFIKIQTKSAYFYGTWVSVNKSSEEKQFDAFEGLSDRTLIPEEGASYSTTFISRKCVIYNDEMFSARSCEPFLVGKIGSAERAKAEKLYGLKTVSGGRNAAIVFYYNGRKATATDFTPNNNIQNIIKCREGIFIDGDGFATPFIEVIPSECRVEIKSSYNSVSKQIMSINEARRFSAKLEGLDTFATNK